MSKDPWSPNWDGPRELLPLLEKGKLEQVCMNCGKTEPAGGRCSHCGINPGWQYWHPNYRTMSQVRNAARRGSALGQNRSQMVVLVEVSK